MSDSQSYRLTHPVWVTITYVIFALMAVGLFVVYAFFLLSFAGSVFKGYQTFENTIISAITITSICVQGFLILKSYQFFTGKNNQFTEGAGFAWALTLLIGGSIVNALFYIFTCAQFFSFH